MVNDSMKQLGNVRSVIRELFEYGKKRIAEIGAENVYDFSLGNPNVPAPEKVNETIRMLLEQKDDVNLHGYTSAQGDANTRAAIAADLNQRYGTNFRADQFYMTCGAAASLKIIITALHTQGDEMIAVTPFFPEYRVFVETAGAKFVVVPSDPDTFQLDFDRLEQAITERTGMMIINSPNNPCGVVYPEEAIQKLAALLEKKEKEYGHPIYLVSDEPYRELVYDAETIVPFLTKYYRDTIICYSYSKSLSMPGERIGYILVPDEAADAADVYAAVCGAGRALGYVCAPSLSQHVIEQCTGLVSDLSVYRENRDLLYNELTKFGYTCVYPDGAFYLFVKSLEEDAGAFCEKAKKYDLLLVPADSFGTPGYARIAYCVKNSMIRRALPAFRRLAEEEYGILQK
jgi:aspartate aminotransferase